MLLFSFNNLNSPLAPHLPPAAVSIVTTSQLHHNDLTALPGSFGLLINLVHLNLSFNKLETFPLPLLALVNLRELHLSNNHLDHLWDHQWKPALKRMLARVGQPAKPDDSTHGSPETSFSSVNGQRRVSTAADSSFGREDFYDLFPSSPTKPKGRRRSQINEDEDLPEAIDTRTIPFPQLEKLSLSANKLTTRSLFGEGSVTLPPGLVELDLSKNVLRDPIDAARTLVHLDRLNNLNLSGCEFSDSIFRFEVEKELDQLDPQSTPCNTTKLFANLNVLDLSHNAIDSLGPLEGFFMEHGGKRALEYVGLPAQVAKLVHPTNRARSPVQVWIGDNFLRDEPKRRRAMITSSIHHPISPEPRGQSPIDTLITSTDGLTLASPPRSSETVSDDARANVSVPEPAKAEDRPMEAQAVSILTDGYFSSTLTLNLHGRNLIELPSEVGIGVVRTADLSFNLLVKLPVSFLLTWSDHLTSLNLSRNKLTTNSLPILNGDGLLPSLTELNLGSNLLTSEVMRGEETLKLFDWLTSLTGSSLKRLDLSFNCLTSDIGLESLLSERGVMELNLSNNQISQLEELERLGSKSRGLRPTFWKLQTLDLRDNHVAKVSVFAVYAPGLKGDMKLVS